MVERPSPPRDDWYRLELAERHVGWTHVSLEEATFEGAPAICVRTELVIRLLRSGTPVELRQSRVVYFGREAPYRPIYLHLVSDESGTERHVEGRAVAGDMRLSIRLGGRASAQTVPLPGDAIFEAATPFCLHAHGFGVGEALSLHTFDGDLLRAVPTRFEALRVEDVLLAGGRTPALVVRRRLDCLGGIETTEWIGAGGVVVREETAMLGTGMTLLLATREQATAVPETSDVDVLLSTAVALRGGPPGNPARFRARVRLAEGDVRAAIPNTSRQTLVAPSPDDWGLLDVRQDVIPDQPAPFPTGPGAWRQYLSPTVYVQSDDPAIGATANEVVTGAKDAWDAAQRLCRWVYRHVADKNLRTGLGTARQTLHSAAGDCTEHTMLAVALSRAAGIPARICSGLVWQKDAFYYHLWYEAFVGTWVAFDPTLDQAPADARRVQLSGGELESETTLELAEGILRTLNRLEMEVLEEGPTPR
jgi:hypothetical protein